MSRDVEVDRTVLHFANNAMERSLGFYRRRTEEVWGRDTGVGNPCGRTMLRVMLENAVGQALMQIRSQTEAGFAVGDRLRTIIDTFGDLDARLGSGWERDYASGLS